MVHLLVKKASSFFDKALTPFWRMFQSLEQVFEAKILIKRLPSFSVAVNMVNLKSLIKKKTFVPLILFVFFTFINFYDITFSDFSYIDGRLLM